MTKNTESHEQLRALCDEAADLLTRWRKLYADLGFPLHLDGLLFSKSGALRLRIKLAQQRDEPGSEEGGEDVFWMPEHCTCWPCNGKITLSDGFMKCEACGVSYGRENPELNQQPVQLGIGREQSMNDSTRNHNLIGDLYRQQLERLERALQGCDSGAELDACKAEYDGLAREYANLADRLRQSRELVDRRAEEIEELERKLDATRQTIMSDSAAWHQEREKRNRQEERLVQRVDELSRQCALVAEQSKLMSEIADDWRKVAVALAITVPGPDV